MNSSQNKRPGGELATRPLHFFWIVDCSGSMEGEKIGSLNYAVRQTIPDMRIVADENPNAKLLIRVLKFSSGAQWQVSNPTPVEDFDWQDLSASGVTDMGKAFELLAEQLKIPPMTERALPPVLVLLTDGQPTDEYKGPLAELHKLPWATKAVKIAIAIGKDTDEEMLYEFTKNKETILRANNPQALINFIKWASTVVKQVSAPTTAPLTNGVPAIDINSIPTVADSVIDSSDIW